MRIINNTISIVEQTKIFNGATGQLEPLKLWPIQKEWVDILDSYDDIVGQKTRQALVTTLTIFVMLLRASLLTNYVSIFISKTGDDAKIALNKGMELFNNLPECYKSPLYPCKLNNEEAIFKTGGAVLSLSPLRGAGMTGDNLSIDEAAHVNLANSKISLNRVISQAGPAIQKRRGQLVMFSNPNGIEPFINRYRQAKLGNNGVKYFFISSSLDPTFTDEIREKTIAQKGLDYVLVNHPRNDVEGVLMSGSCRFNTNVLNNKILKCKNPDKIGTLQNLDGKVHFVDDLTGYFYIWELPLRDTQYILYFDSMMGIEDMDIADTTNRKDYHVCQVYKINPQNGYLTKVAKYKSQVPADIADDDIYALGLYYNKGYIGGEDNSSGQFILKNISKELKYPKMYYTKSTETSTQTKKITLGLKITSANKPMIIDKLDEWIRNDYLIDFDEEFWNECFTFIRHKNGKLGAATAAHDDEVMAAAGGVWINQFIPKETEFKQKTQDEIAIEFMQQISHTNIQTNQSWLAQ